MSGESAEQAELSAEELTAYKQAAQMTVQQYANQQAIFGPMTAQFEKIFSGGPNQPGFSKEEQDTLNASVIEGTAANYKGAAKALGDAESSLGGGTSPLEGGAEQQQKELLAESSAGEESREETGIKEASFEQGRNNWKDAGAGLTEIATLEDPTRYESGQSGVGSTAGSLIDSIASRQNSWVTAAIGAAGGIASDGLTYLGNRNKKTG